MDRFRVISQVKKGPALTRGTFGCLKNAYSLNVTMGCSFSCVYCYARGYRNAPLSSEVYLYANLPEKLHGEITNPRRRRPIKQVVLNTASDCFQPHPDILDTAFRVIKVLLESGAKVSFLTKGSIPDRFFPLFRDFPGRVEARIGLVSLAPRYHVVFEPRTAPAEERLDNIRNLKEVGITPQVRVDPIVPFFSDGDEDLALLFERLAQLGVKRAVLSYLHMRPSISDQMKRELPGLPWKVIESCFAGKGWQEVGSSTRSKLIARGLRQKGYERIRSIAHSHGVETAVCACKNPDIAGDWCVNWQTGKLTGEGTEPKGEQLRLFPPIPRGRGCCPFPRWAS